MQQFDLEFRLDVDLVVMLGALAIDILLPILAHHDERRRIGGLKRERQIKQDERIGIPLLDVGRDVESDPEKQDKALDDDEVPRAHRRRNVIRDSLPNGEVRLLRWRTRDGLAKTAAQFSEFGQQQLFCFVKLNLQGAAKAAHGLNPSSNAQFQRFDVILVTDAFRDEPALVELHRLTPQDRRCRW